MLLIPLETGTNAFCCQSQELEHPKESPRLLRSTPVVSLMPKHVQGRCRGQSNVTTGSFLLDSSPCQDILLWFLEKAEREQSLAVLEGLARLSSHVPTLHPQCQLRVGSEGGAAIIVRETIR